MDKVENNINITIENIKEVDAAPMKRAAARWNSIAKPLHGMGKLEDLVIQLAGIQRTDRVRIDKKALVVMCADNGVVEEGVTQTGQEVTAIVAGNFHGGETTAAILCESAGVDLFPVDVGMIVDVPGMDRRKTLYGTKNMAKGPAMTREEACAAVWSGMQVAAELKEKHPDTVWIRGNDDDEPGYLWAAVKLTNFLFYPIPPRTEKSKRTQTENGKRHTNNLKNQKPMRGA